MHVCGYYESMDRPRCRWGCGSAHVLDIHVHACMHGEHIWMASMDGGETGRQQGCFKSSVNVRVLPAFIRPMVGK